MASRLSAFGSVTAERRHPSSCQRHSRPKPSDTIVLVKAKVPIARPPSPCFCLHAIFGPCADAKIFCNKADMSSLSSDSESKSIPGQTYTNTTQEDVHENGLLPQILDLRILEHQALQLIRDAPHLTLLNLDLLQYNPPFLHPPDHPLLFTR